MDKIVIKNFRFNFIYQIMLLVLPVVTTPYISRILGVDNIGIYSFTASVCSYFVIAITFGFHIFGQREIAKNHNDKKKCSVIFYKIQIEKLIVSVFVISTYLIFLFFQKEYSYFYLIQVISLIAVFFDISYFYQGLELYSITVVLNGIIRLTGILLIFVLIRTKDDLGLYIFISCVTVLLGNISLWFYLPKYIETVLFHDINIFRNFKDIVILFIPIISIQLYFNIDKTMLGLFTDGPTENGYYEQAIKIIRIGQTVITSIGGVLISSISRMISDSKDELIKETVQGAVQLGLFIAVPMVFGLLAISDIFVPIFFGDGYNQVSLLLKILSPIIFFSAISNIAGNGVLIPTNKHKYVSLAATIGAILNIVLNIFFISKWYAVGAGIASVIAEFMVLVIQYFYAKEYFDTNIIIKYSLKCFISSLIMFVILLCLKKYLYDYLTSGFLMIILIGIGVIIYLVFLLILGGGSIKKYL